MDIDDQTRAAIRTEVNSAIESSSGALQDAIRRAVRSTLLEILTGGEHPEEGFLYRIVELEKWRGQVERVTLWFAVPIIVSLTLAVVFFIASVITHRVEIVFH